MCIIRKAEIRALGCWELQIDMIQVHMWIYQMYLSTYMMALQKSLLLFILLCCLKCSFTL